MKRILAFILAIFTAVAVCSFCVNAAAEWTKIAIDDSAAVYVAPSGGAISESVVIEGASLCTVIPDQDDAYAEVSFNGTGFRLYMLCNVQDGGNVVYNAPALDVYIDGKASGKIEMIDINKFNWKNAADLVWEVTGLTKGDHTVKFVNSTVNDLPIRAAYFMGYEVYDGKAIPHAAEAALEIEKTVVCGDKQIAVKFNQAVVVDSASVNTFGHVPHACMLTSSIGMVAAKDFPSVAPFFNYEATDEGALQRHTRLFFVSDKDPSVVIFDFSGKNNELITDGGDPSSADIPVKSAYDAIAALADGSFLAIREFPSDCIKTKSGVAFAAVAAGGWVKVDAVDYALSNEGTTEPADPADPVDPAEPAEPTDDGYVTFNLGAATLNENGLVLNCPGYGEEIYALDAYLDVDRVMGNGENVIEFTFNGTNVIVKGAAWDWMGAGDMMDVYLDGTQVLDDYSAADGTTKYDIDLYNSGDLAAGEHVLKIVTSGNMILDYIKYLPSGAPADPTPADPKPADPKPADPKPSTPSTADIAIILALMAAASGTGLVLGKKRK